MSDYDPRSGLHVAQAAYDAGAAAPPVALELFDVTLSFVVRGRIEDARAIGHDLADVATILHMVEAPVSLSIVQRSRL